MESLQNTVNIGKIRKIHKEGAGVGLPNTSGEAIKVSKQRAKSQKREPPAFWPGGEGFHLGLAFSLVKGFYASLPCYPGPGTTHWSKADRSEHLPVWQELPALGRIFRREPSDR